MQKQVFDQLRAQTSQPLCKGEIAFFSLPKLTVFSARYGSESAKSFSIKFRIRKTGKPNLRRKLKRWKIKVAYPGD